MKRAKRAKSVGMSYQRTMTLVLAALALAGCGVDDETAALRERVEELEASATTVDTSQTTSTASTTTTLSSDRRVEGIVLFYPFVDLGEGQCENAFNDWPVGRGSTVEVSDGSGVLVGVGQLGKGVIIGNFDRGGEPLMCLHAFSTMAPPSPAYRIKIGDIENPYDGDDGYFVSSAGTGPTGFLQTGQLILDAIQAERDG